MNHSYYRDRLSAYCDSQLTLEEMEAVRLHLEECAECRKYLVELEHFNAFVNDQVGLNADDYFERNAAKIESALGFNLKTNTTKKGNSHSNDLGWKLATIAASILILSFIGIHKDEIFREAQPEIMNMYYKQMAPAPTQSDGDKSGRVIESDMQAKQSRTIDSASKNEEIDKNSDGIKEAEKPSPSVMGDVKDEVVTDNKVEVVSGELAEEAPASPKLDINPQAVIADSDERVESVHLEAQALSDGALFETWTGSSETTGDELLKQYQNPTGKEQDKKNELLKTSIISAGKAEDSSLDLGESSPESLEELISKRDSLLILYNEMIEMPGKGERPGMEKMDLLQKNDQDQKRKSIEKQLLYSFYNIAIQSRNKGDIEKARVFYDNYINKPGSAFKEKALLYLDSLENIPK